MPPDTSILYSFRRCPYAMRARLALAVSGQTCSLREVVLADKPAALLEASPKGTVPVLQLPGGVVIDQSLDIMLWALRSNDPLCWLPARGAGMARALHWIAQCDGPFKQALDRYKYPHRYALPDGLDDRTRGADFLHVVDQCLAQHGSVHAACLDPAMGETPPVTFGLADAAIAPFVRQFAATDTAWFASEPWPALQAWLVQFLGSPLLAQVMEKYPRWAPEQAPVAFPP
jgi:glutathione S-transferase